MAREMNENQSRSEGSKGDDRHAPVERRGSGGFPVGLLVAGAVGAGLAYLAWSYIEPDLRRYLKIRSM